MSGLAEIFIKWRIYLWVVQMLKDSLIIERLKNLGANIYINHKESNVNGADLIIYTDAISKDNEELVKAHSHWSTCNR